MDLSKSDVEVIQTENKLWNGRSLSKASEKDPFLRPTVKKKKKIGTHEKEQDVVKETVKEIRKIIPLRISRYIEC